LSGLEIYSARPLLDSISYHRPYGFDPNLRTLAMRSGKAQLQQLISNWSTQWLNLWAAQQITGEDNQSSGFNSSIISSCLW